MEQHWLGTQRRLATGGCALLLLLGGGLVGLLYGRGAALVAVSLMVLLFGLGGLIWLIVGLLDRWAER